MAALFIDCLEMYNSNATQTRGYWTGSNAGSYGGVDSGAGGIGASITCNEDDSMLFPIPSLSTGVLKWRMQQTIIRQNVHTDFLQLYNNVDSVVQLSMSCSLDGQIQLFRGPAASGTLLATSGDNRINSGLIYHFSLKYEVANSTSGAVTLYVNGQEWLNLASGADTQHGSTSSTVTSAIFSHARFVEGNAVYYDFASFDTTGSKNNDHRGTPRVVPLYANGNGNHSDFVGSDADSTDNYLHVDEEGVADDKTSYVESDTATDRQSVAVENLPSTPQTVLAVQVQNLLKKTDAGTRTFQNFLRIGGVNYDGATKSADVSYIWSYDIWDVDPGDSNDFTETDVNGIEVGIEIVS